jgi:hypothetical protein
MSDFYNQDRWLGSYRSEDVPYLDHSGWWVGPRCLRLEYTHDDGCPCGRPHGNELIIKFDMGSKTLGCYGWIGLTTPRLYAEVYCLGTRQISLGY